MVRITHNPLTNSAVITPLYGPLAPNPSYLQPSLGNLSQPGKMASTSSSQQTVEPPKKANQQQVPVSKPSNPVLQQPASVPTNLANNSTSNSSQPPPQQMVTIRRVMQPNLSEPMVTVTLKGETPDNDRVLFTLVNGQVLPTVAGQSNGVSNQSVGAPAAAKSQKHSNSVPKNSSGNTAAAAPTPVQSKKKQKKQEKKKLRKLLQANSNIEDEFVPPPQPQASVCSNPSNLHLLFQYLIFEFLFFFLDTYQSTNGTPSSSSSRLYS